MIGAFGETVEIVLQARGSLSVTAATRLEPEARSSDSAAEFEIVAPERGDRDSRRFVRGGGAIPLDRALVVERVETYAEFQSNYSEVEFEVGGRSLFELEDQVRPRREAFEGVVVLLPAEKDGIELEVRRGAAAEVRVFGRLVPRAEAAEIEQVPFTWVERGSEPRFEGGTIRMQILADHGGGNPRTLRLDGSANNRFDEIRENEIWDRGVDVEKNRKSLGWMSVAPRLGPDTKIRLLRIDYRARLAPGGSSHSDLTVRHDGKELIRVTADKDKEPSGAWTGDLVIGKDDLREFEFTMHYKAMGEITLHTSIVE